MTAHTHVTPSDALSIMIGGKRNLLLFSDILRLEASRNYTWIYLADGKKALSYRNLSKLQQKLPDAFVRVGRSHLVNPKFSLGITEKSGEISLCDNVRIKIPRRNARHILQKFLAPCPSKP